MARRHIPGLGKTWERKISLKAILEQTTGDPTTMGGLGDVNTGCTINIMNRGEHRRRVPWESSRAGHGVPTTPLLQESLPPPRGGWRTVREPSWSDESMRNWSCASCATWSKG